MLKLDSKKAREISDLVNSKVSILDVLKKSGLKLVLSGSTWKALCPFHDDKDTASFTVKPEYNYVHCFGCDKTWFPVKFIMDYEKKTWTEAIEQLAITYSINLANFHKELTTSELVIEDAKAVNKAAAQWLHQQVDKYPKAKQYLLSRYDNEMISQWQLGYCYNGEKLLDHLLKKCKFDYNLIQKVDIHPYMFNDRIVYPVFDMFGNIVGFSCRVWALSKEEEEKKYQNVKAQGTYRKFINTSGKSILFKYKSSNLYGLHLARKGLRKHKGTIILVEGCSDVILMHKHGFDNCAGVLSAAFNKHSLATLVDVATQKIIFCLDGDSTGQKRTLELLSTQQKLLAEMPENAIQIQYRAISIPGGQDPDEYLAKPENVASLKKLIDNALSLPEFYLQYKQQNKTNIASITDKIDFIFNIRKELAPLLSRAEMTIVCNYLRDSMGITPTDFHEYTSLNGNKIQIKKTEEKILAWLVQDKEFREHFLPTIFISSMFSDGYSALFRIIKDLYMKKIPDLPVTDELDDNRLNIDSIIKQMKRLRLMTFFPSEQTIKNILLAPLVQKQGLLQDFWESTKQKKIRNFVGKLNNLVNQHTYNEIIDYIKDNLSELE